MINFKALQGLRVLMGHDKKIQETFYNNRCYLVIEVKKIYIKKLICLGYFWIPF